MADEGVDNQASSEGGLNQPPEETTMLDDIMNDVGNLPSSDLNPEMQEEVQQIIVTAVDDKVEENTQKNENKPEIKAFTFRQKKVELFQGDIEELEIKSFVLPKHISSQLGIEPDPSYLEQPSKKKKPNDENQMDESPTLQESSEEDIRDTISFKKNVKFRFVQRELKLKKGRFSKLSIRRAIRIQKSKKLTIFKESFLKKNQSQLKSFISRDFKGNMIGEDKFVEERIKFLNTVDSLEGPNSIPPRSTPTICQEHSRGNLSRIKNMRVDGDL